MANQTAWYRDTPGQTLYAYPLSEAIADWATYAVTFTEKGDGGGWYSAVLDDTVALDWAIFDSVPTGWDESEYASVNLTADPTGEGAPYYPTVTRNVDDENPVFFSWASNVPLTVQRSFNGGAFSAATGTASFSRLAGSLFLFELSYSADDRPSGGVVEYSISDGSDTYYLPLSINTGAGGGGGGGGGDVNLVTVEGQDATDYFGGLAVFSTLAQLTQNETTVADPISIVKGDDYASAQGTAKQIAFTDADSSLFNRLNAADEIKFGMGDPRKAVSADLLTSLGTATHASGSTVISFEFTSTQTAALALGEYEAQIQVTEDSDKESTIATLCVVVVPDRCS